MSGEDSLCGLLWIIPFRHVHPQHPVLIFFKNLLSCDFDFNLP